MALIDDTPPRPAAPTRYRLSWAVVDAMFAAGILPDKAPIELRDGELVLMPAEGGFHLDVKSAVIASLIRAAPVALKIGVDGPLRLAEFEGPEPDVFVAAGVASPAKATGRDAVLVIEVSESSLRYDLGEKAQKYARHGVREYWVIDLVHRRTLVHRDPDADLWRDVRIVAPEETVSPMAIPGWAFRLQDVLAALGA